MFSPSQSRDKRQEEENKGLEAVSQVLCGRSRSGGYTGGVEQRTTQLQSGGGLWHSRPASRAESSRLKSRRGMVGRNLSFSESLSTDSLLLLDAFILKHAKREKTIRKTPLVSNERVYWFSTTLSLQFGWKQRDILRQNTVTWYHSTGFIFVSAIVSAC